MTGIDNNGDLDKTLYRVELDYEVMKGTAYLVSL